MGQGENDHNMYDCEVSWFSASSNNPAVLILTGMVSPHLPTIVVSTRDTGLFPFMAVFNRQLARHMRRYSKGSTTKKDLLYFSLQPVKYSDINILTDLSARVL
jgi:hypothetical protein